jgi:hypothetical protein
MNLKHNIRAYQGKANNQEISDQFLQKDNTWYPREQGISAVSTPIDSTSGGVGGGGGPGLLTWEWPIPGVLPVKHKYPTLLEQ